MSPSVRLYRVLVRACPREFRSSYGDQTVAAFAEMIGRRTNEGGRAAAAAFAFAAYGDILLTALRERGAAVAGDAAFALRLIAKSWITSSIVIATLAIVVGIGATVFSAIDAVLLAPLPYADPSRLVFIFDRPYDAPAAHGTETSLPNALDWPKMAQSFSAMGSYANWTPTLTGVSAPIAVPGQYVTGRFFEALGVRPRLGRLIDETDAVPGAPHTVVISESFWQRAFGGEPTILGRSISLSDLSYKVVGVLPHSFVMPRNSSLAGHPSDVYRALARNASPRDSHYLITIARLRPGVTVRSAAADMERVGALLRARFPVENANLAQHVIPMSEQLFGSARLMLAIALAAVVGLVLIACLNVSNILIGRVAERERELSIRLAVGASRGRLIQQLFVESALLAAAGGALGLGLCAFLVRIVPAFGFNLPRIGAVHVSPLVVLFVLGITCACAAGIGTLPALAVSRPRLSGSRGSFARSAAVVVELAVALALVTGSALLVRSFVALTAIDVGFNYGDVVASDEVMLPMRRYPSAGSQLAFAHALLTQLRALPELQSPGLMVSTPLSNASYNAEEFRIVGRRQPKNRAQDVEYNAVTPGALQALRVHLLRGRLLDDGDSEHSAPVAIVTKAFVRQNFPTEDPIGRRIVIAYGANPPWGRRIVGVIDDFKMESLTEAPMAQVVVPFYQDVMPTFQVVARTRAGTPHVATEISQAFSAIDREIPATRAHAYAAFVSGQRSSASTVALMLGFMALVGLLLAGLGTYGVVAYTVGRRAREFGIRRALGANARAIALSVLVQVGALSGVGILLGVVLSAVSVRAIAALLYEVSPFDPLTFLAVAAILGVTAFVASLLPMLRAMRIDPAVVLRQE
ncbi:MAG TPA: ADOP family duplicated permease [Candidatus Cybelea sp.]|jgi:putative ABC transport system permease protein|nr:ADOP family duplicated permease [Candidatus Cybelea sp.]